MSHREARARTAAEVLSDVRDRSARGEYGARRPLPTGFRPLDQTLSGGVRPGDLLLVGGHPGVGKTIATLQWARHMAVEGTTVLYTCYEHDELDLLARLAMMEAGEPEPAVPGLAGSRLRAAIAAVEESGGTLREHIDREEVAGVVEERLAPYAGRLFLTRAAGSATGVPEIEALLAESSPPPRALFVDYLQKVSVRPDPGHEAERVTQIVEGLKDLALRHEVAVVAVAAAEHVAADGGRLRLQHLRSAAALGYESDIVVMLNDKMTAVSKVHLAYDPLRAATFRHHVVFSIEKNRGGQAHLDMEFRKDFRHYRFDPDGAFVAERLANAEEA